VILFLPQSGAPLGFFLLPLSAPQFLLARVFLFLLPPFRLRGLALFGNTFLVLMPAFRFRGPLFRGPLFRGPFFRLPPLFAFSFFARTSLAQQCRLALPRKTFLFPLAAFRLRSLAVRSL